MRIFYGVYVDDIELSAAIDLVRWLAEPDYYRRCHLTVRGPYERRLPEVDIERFNGQLRSSGNVMTLLDVGSFFLGKQNTVILQCEIVGIRDIWHKPDFRNGEPHITLYDGGSHQSARFIKYVASQFSWNLVAAISELQVIEKKSRVEEYLDVYFERVWSLGEQLIGESFSPRSVAGLDWLDRVNAITRVMQFMNSKTRWMNRSTPLTRRFTG